jgi:amino acid transporter
MSAPTPVAPKRRELTRRHLILFAISSVTGARPIAQAAHAGAASILLWVLAAIGVMMPLAAACADLTARSPGTGGMYGWARDDFGPWHGFLCFWIYWMGIAFWFPAAAMLYSSVAIFGLGPGYAHLADNRICVIAVSLTAMWLALGTNLIGLGFGKWTENLGAICGTLLCVVLCSAAVLVWWRSGTAGSLFAFPRMNLDTASFWPNIAFGMTGMELVGMMGAEIADPRRDVRRAAWVSAVFGCVFFISITLALLVLSRPENLSELYGVAQGGAIVGRLLGANFLGPLVAILIIGNAIGQFGSCGTATSQLPLGAGVDSLLPSAFGRVHPRWGTPYLSILLLGAIASFLILVVQTGDSMRGAYNALLSLMTVGSFLPFFYIYASAWKAGLRVIAAIGISVTASVLIWSAIPTRAVESLLLFEMKLVLGTLAMIGSGWLIYRSSHRHRNWTD